MSSSSTLSPIKDRAGAGQQVISISYLGLTREQPASGEYEASWAGWYSYFPWEDHRLGAPAIIEERARAAAACLDRGDGRSRRSARPAAARRDHLRPRRARRGTKNSSCSATNSSSRRASFPRRGAARKARRATIRTARRPDGRSMILDHRRILATGIARLRAKIKYHPVVFELMPETFTLLQLQRCVEALAGRLRSQTKFSPPHRAAGTCRGNRRNQPGYRGKAGQTVPLPPRRLHRTRHRRHETAHLQGLTNLILIPSIWRVKCSNGV